MSKFDLSVHEYRQELERKHGRVDERRVQAFANKKMEWKRKLKRKSIKDKKPKDKPVSRSVEHEHFNPFTDDPNCKTCGKNKVKKNAQ